MFFSPRLELPATRRRDSLAEAIHRRFAAMAGSEQIASQFAIAGLLRWAVGRRCSLELGGGIGTLTTAMLMYPLRHQLVIEPDTWCRRAFMDAVGAHVNLELLRNFAMRPYPYDLVVVDGCENCTEWHAVLDQRAGVFVEGNRRGQRAAFAAYLTGRKGRRYTVAQWKPRDRSKGFWVYQLEPTIRERLWFAGVRLREWARDQAARSRGAVIGKRAR